jgi:hypothetical protein
MSGQLRFYAGAALTTSMISSLLPELQYARRGSGHRNVRHKPERREEPGPLLHQQLPAGFWPYAFYVFDEGL